MCGAELRTELRNFCHDGLWRETTCRACLAILAGNTGNKTFKGNMSLDQN